jgi:hypothetical protein
MKLKILMESTRKNRLLKKMALKTNFGCESYVLLKRCIKGNQRVTWQLEVGSCSDAPPYLTFLISSLLTTLLMK